MVVLPAIVTEGVLIGLEDVKFSVTISPVFASDGAGLLELMLAKLIVGTVRINVYVSPLLKLPASRFPSLLTMSFG